MPQRPRQIVKRSHKMVRYCALLCCAVLLARSTIASCELPAIRVADWAHRFCLLLFVLCSKVLHG